MPEVIPSPFLFRFSLPVKKLAGLPKRGKRLLDLPSECSLPDLGELQGLRPTGDLRVAWNDDGLAFSLKVRGKQDDPDADERSPFLADGLQLWIDTRNTQTIHRASRYCHHFCFAPVGGGSDGSEPFAVQLPIAQAREQTPLATKNSLAVRVEMLSDGYVLETWLRREQLNGFDPAADREAKTPTRLGFFFAIRDRELGPQTLTVDDRFPFTFDPSMWSTLELIDD